MDLNKFWKILPIVLFCSLVFSLVIFLSIFKITSVDSFQYLANGKYLAEHHLSQACVFNYSSAECQIVYPQWLFQIITYGTYSFAGGNAMVWLQVLLVVAIFLVIFRYQMKSGYSYLSSLSILALVALVAQERFILRAELPALLLATAFYVVLINARKLFVAEGWSKKTKIVFAGLLFLQVIWANVHGSFLLGWALIGAFLVEDIIHLMRSRHRPDRLMFSFLVLIGCVAATLINPYGIKTIIQPLVFYFGPAEFHSQNEFMSPFTAVNFTPLSLKAYQILLGVVIATLVLNIKKIKLADALILAGFLYLSFQAIRNIALFAVFAGLIMPYYLDTVVVYIKRRVDQIRFKKIIYGTGLLVLLVLGAQILHFEYTLADDSFYIGDSSLRRFGWGISEIRFPIGASEFIAENGISGNMFNDYGSGAYVNWRLFPERKSFIDSHTYTLELLEYYRAVMRGQIDYHELVQKYDINYFIISHDQDDVVLLMKKLYDDPAWVPVYFDENAIIFIADKPENKTVIQKHKINFEKGKNFNSDKLVTFIDKHNFSLGFMRRGTVLANLGLYNMARQQYEMAIQDDPYSFLALSNTGVLNYGLGQKDIGCSYMKQALEKNDKYASLHYYVAICFQYYFGDLDKAVTEYKKVLAIHPKYINAHYNLGIIFEKQGKLNLAEKEYQKELQIRPQATEIQNALERLRSLK